MHWRFASVQESINYERVAFACCRGLGYVLWAEKVHVGPIVILLVEVLVEAVRVVWGASVDGGMVKVDDDEGNRLWTFDDASYS